jgi:hypothetical protein
MHLSQSRSLVALLMAAASIGPQAALAHGFVGQRFFPATIATDDPFVADELSLPTISSVRNNASEDAPASRQTTIAFDFSKRITQNLGLSIGAARQHFRFADQTSASGNDNVELGLKYQVYKNEASETIMSVGLGWEVGGTGSKSIGSDSFSTYRPNFFFGKGFGDARVDALRPLAITGSIGVAIPGRSSTSTNVIDPDTGLSSTQIARNPHVLQVGLAFEYSIPYLQSAVKDTGLGAPWNRMIPIVEIAASKPIDRVADRGWTGTINPGVLWAGRKVQLGIEAIVPMNRASGQGVGVQAQLHFFIDDLFPRTFGRPLFGGGT